MLDRAFIDAGLAQSGRGRQAQFLRFLINQEKRTAFGA